jgi:hypothetical protein
MKVWIKTQTRDGHVTIHRDPPRVSNKGDTINSFHNRDGEMVVEVKDSLGSVRSTWIEVDLLR